MISGEAAEWLNSIVRRHKQSRKVVRTLPAAKKKTPVDGGAGASDSPTIGSGA